MKEEGELTHPNILELLHPRKQGGGEDEEDSPNVESFVEEGEDPVPFLLLVERAFLVEVVSRVLGHGERGEVRVVEGGWDGVGRLVLVR